ncbi:MAG: hypothetical protein AB7O44_28595, partial [Hyphomicrobiaceae bacterium]
DGPDRRGMWSLRAPSRRITVPQGAIEGTNQGGRRKLSVVRRNWAGQLHARHILRQQVELGTAVVDSIVYVASRVTCQDVLRVRMQAGIADRTVETAANAVER